MSDQFRKINEEPHSHEAPGKRLEKKAKPVLTPAQAKKQKEKRVMIVMIAFAAVMVIAAAAALLYTRLFQKPGLPPGPGQSGAPVQSGPPGSPDPEETLNFDAVQPKVGGARKSQDIYTILIFGSDETSGLTDTMMVATYDVTNQKATVMSLPRDTITNSSSYGIANKKLNAVYNIYGKGERGLEALKNEVSELVGFTPDYYVRIDWELVGEMVNAIGGVWFDNPYHMEYYDPFQNLNIYQEQGYRKLNGDDAMQVVRWRKNNPGVSSKGGTGSDTDRLKVQHAFLKAVLQQTLQIGNITRIGQLIDLFNSRVESDLSVENMFWFAKQAVVGGLNVEAVNFCTMPYLGGSYYLDGQDQSFVYPIQSQLLTLINESLNPYVEQVTVRQLDLISIAPDGSLRSSTGRLADPALGMPPVRESDEPEESGPSESGAPAESGQPQGSAPVTTEPPPSGAVESGPLPSQPVDTPPPPANPAETDPQPTPSPTPIGEPANGDWGDTLD